MKEILNKNEENYAKECLTQALEMGLNFKLNAEFKASIEKNCRLQSENQPTGKWP